jgi:hypothetical protein
MYQTRNYSSLQHKQTDGNRLVPLCEEFLSPSLVYDQVKSKCNAILESGEPYPHVNEMAQVACIVRILNIISTALEYGPAPFALAPLSKQWWLCGAWIIMHEKGREKKRQNSPS